MKKIIIYACSTLIFLSINDVWAQKKKQQKSVAKDTVGIYQGDFNALGQRHGKGSYTWPDGSTYEGRWRNNRMDGEGKLVFTDDTSYEGDFMLGLMHGYGVYRWPNGDKYTGFFKNNIKHGNGVLEMANGAKHEGRWIEDQIQGEGKRTYASGVEYFGMFENGLPNGQGIKIHKDGRIEQGMFLEGNYQACQCPTETLTVMQAFEQSASVFVGEVSDIQNLDGYDVVTFNVLEYWKGGLYPGKRALLKANYSSCDHVFFEGKIYMVYANPESEGLYITNKCTRTAELDLAGYDIKVLREELTCIDKNQNKPESYFRETDYVCGCDEKTYKNPYQAKKEGVQRWTAGQCQ